MASLAVKFSVAGEQRLAVVGEGSLEAVEAG
jgi:hypothetical protein